MNRVVLSGIVRGFLALSAMTLAGCNLPSPAPKVGDETIWQTTEAYAEIASAVIPEGVNPACPQGKVFIAAADNNFPGILSADLTQSGQTLNVTALSASAFSISPDDTFGSADILITTLPKGGLLVVLQGGSVAPLTPKPAWWDVYSKDPNTDPSWTDGIRGALHLWRSFDCGTSWERLPDIDSASSSIFSGQCGVPQADKNKAPRRGGFDREEIYVDPWTGRIFLTTGCMGGGYGSYAAFHAGVIFSSTDNGSTWTAAADTLTRATPIVMTSTPNGRLYLAQCVYDDAIQGYPTTLYWMDPPWTAVEGGVQIFFGDKTDPGSRCQQLPDASKAGSAAYTLSAKVIQARVLPPSLSRVHSDALGDTLRIAFPAVLNWRQVARIVNVHIGPDDSVVALPVRSIQAEDSAGDVILANFVETDRFQLKQETNPSMLYWLESNGAGQLFARFALVDDAVKWSPAGDLSRLGGVRDAWTPTGDFVGDYMKGAFFFQDTQVNFLGAWSVQSKQQVRYNIVSRPLPGFAKLPDFTGAVQMQPIPLDQLRAQPPGILQDAPLGAIVELAQTSPVGSAEQPGDTPTLPPTLTSVPAVLPTDTPAAACLDKAKFIADVSFPDNTQASPGQGFTKVWRLRNDGTCTWNEEYKVVFIGGDSMSNNTPLAIPAIVPPGAMVDLAVDMVAPAGNGTYRGDYQIRDPQGVHFGVGASGQTPFYIQIVVEQAAPPRPTSPPASDTQPPSVNVSHSPDGGSLPTGSTIRFTASAGDNVGVTRIDLYVTAPGQFPGKVKTCDNTTTCSYTGGPYSTQGNLTYYAVAVDAAGNEANSAPGLIVLYVVIARLARPLL
ncbi:MAG: NBR1-Ig-like domain-containing protein [Anaerolineales bacterium]|nr:NBR1-Ig-like domain-containing protein [Anaerolineales bacterium]